MLNNKNLVIARKLFYNVTYSVSSHGTGSVNLSGKVKVGTKVTIAMSPNTYWVANVPASRVSLFGSGNTRTFIMPKNNISISITFNEVPKYSINCSNCSASSNPAYAGQRVTIRPSIPSNALLNNITVDDIGSTTSTLYSFTMPAYNVNVHANFTYAGNQSVSIFYTVDNFEKDKGPFSCSFAGYSINTSHGSTETIRLTSGSSYTLNFENDNTSVSCSASISGSGIKGNWYVAAYGFGSNSDTTTFYAKPNISNANMSIRIELGG